METINNTIYIIKAILAEKCGLSPEIYNELDDLLDDVKILSNAMHNALISANDEIKQLTN